MRRLSEEITVSGKTPVYLFQAGICFSFAHLFQYFQNKKDKGNIENKPNSYFIVLLLNDKWIHSF